MARKKREIEKRSQVTNIGKQSVVKDGRFDLTLRIINTVIRGVGLIAIVIYAGYTVSLYESAKVSNNLLKEHLKVLEEEYELLETQYELSMEPQLYVQFVEEGYYLEYLKAEMGVAAGKRDLYAQKYMESKEATIYLRTVNVSLNMANQVTAFVFSADEQSLYGSSDATGFIKPETEYVFPIDLYYKNEEGIKAFIIQIYESRECDRILESGYLGITGENSYIVIIYKDLRGTIYLAKTGFYVETKNGETFTRFRKTNRYKL